MPSISPYLKSKKAFNAAKDKARAERRQKAFDNAVLLTLGDSVTDWTLEGNYDTAKITTVTRHIKDKQDRVYPIDQLALKAKVEEIQKERASKIPEIVEPKTVEIAIQAPAITGETK